MTKLTSISQINVILGNAIVAQTQLDKKYVLNGKSLYGVNREKIDDYIATTFKDDDSYVVFLLEPDESSDDMTEETVENKIDVYDSYLFTIMCYGTRYNELALQLKSRLLTEECQLSIQNQGIHIQSIDLSRGISEFINDTLVNRRDVMLHISCQFEVSKVSNAEEMNSMNETFKVETV